MTATVDQEIRWRPIAYPVVPEDKMVVRLLVKWQHPDGVFLRSMYGYMDGDEAYVGETPQDLGNDLNVGPPKKLPFEEVVAWAELEWLGEVGR